MKIEAPTDNLNASPLVNTIAATLTKRIAAGGYRDRRGFPSERDLIQEFGVSRTVIRKVLDLLEERELLVRAPRCRTVVRTPSSAGEPTPMTKRRTIGLGMLSSPYDPGTATILQGINRTLDHDDYRVVIGSVIWNSWDAVWRTQVRFLEQMLEDQDISGVLLWYLGGMEALPALQKVRAANIPMVFMDRQPPPGIEADYVGVDNIRSAEQVVRHLIQRGHRRIAHISNEDAASTVEERLLGYRRALEEAGLPFRPEWVVQANESSVEEVLPVYADLSERLLSLDEPPTAAFAVNDVIASRFIESLRLRGLRVPDDMAVAGFDGIERLTHSQPFLTTAYQPFEQIGRRAVSLLLRRIESGDAFAYQQVLLQAPLHIHGSTLS